MRIHGLLGVSTALLALAAPVWAAGVTWRVTNDGTDSANCGNAATPCRSISQAIENASAGDTISVGAGLYGNVSGDGSFTHPGDEHAQFVYRFGASGEPEGCIICITKAVKVLSLHGAAATIIVGTSSTTYPATVQIASGGVTFGNVGQGFTITGGNGIGVYFDQDVVPALQKNINIAGNVDVGDGTGFALNGLEFSDRPCPDPRCAATATVFFTSNQATNNGTGFSLVDNAYTGAAAFKSNVASGAGRGFFVASGFQSESGSARGVGNVSLSGNIATHNGYGFSLAQTGPIVGNSAFANTQAGFLVVPGSVFQGNSAIGNGGPGLIIQAATDVFDVENSDPGDQIQVFNHNNFYGNDRNRPALLIHEPNGGGDPSLDPGPSARCGVLNVGKVTTQPGGVGPTNGGPTSVVVVQTATNNFWGSAKGPSATGPGDAAGGPCDRNGGVTITKPFATVDFPITTTP
jgi:hypothetical protein